MVMYNNPKTNIQLTAPSCGTEGYTMPFYMARPRSIKFSLVIMIDYS